MSMPVPETTTDRAASGRLAGAVAVITGAGSGIGKATAELFAHSGACVIAVDIDAASALQTADALHAFGGQALAITADVSQSGDVRDVMRAAIDAFGGLDILVNNAGVGVAGDVTETSDADLERVLSVNVNGTFIGCREAIPHMLARGGGIIVNVASAAALSAVPSRAAYVASKGAIVALTRSISVDFVARGIRCNCVAPGTIESPWISTILSGHSEPVEARRQMVARQPVGRLGRPDEVAAAILYLASPEAAFVHGTCLVIDGGFTAR